MYQPPTKPLVAVAYKTPGERATATLTRTAWSAAAAVLIVAVGPVLLEFLYKGDFSRASVRSLIVAVVTAVLVIGINWAVKYNQAVSEQRAPLQQQYPPRPTINPALANAAVEGIVADYLASRKPLAAAPPSAPPSEPVPPLVVDRATPSPRPCGTVDQRKAPSLVLITREGAFWRLQNANAPCTASGGSASRASTSRS